MQSTRLSSKGQVIIPKAIRSAHRWEVGQELLVLDVGDGILLKPKPSFPETRLEEVAGCLSYEGKPKTLEEMEEGIRIGARESARDCR